MRLVHLFLVSVVRVDINSYNKVDKEFHYFFKY